MTLRSTTRKRSEDEEAPDLGASSVPEVMEAAGKVLTRRAHSETELRTKLSRFDPADVDAACERLRHLGLLDDRAFAVQWVEERSAKRGPALLAAELEGKGVEPEIVAEALETAEGSALETAVELAHRQMRKVIRKPLPQQAVSVRGALLRRGFEAEVVDEALRAVLPPEGWD